MARPTWDETWMAVADVVSRRSRCDRRQVGAVIVGVTNKIVATGYNGPPGGLKLEYESTCRTWCSRARTGVESSSYDNCMTVHAEANALMYADRSRMALSTLYVNSSICWDCAKMVANSGVARVVVKFDAELDAHRNPERSFIFMEECGLEVHVV